VEGNSAMKVLTAEVAGFNIIVLSLIIRTLPRFGLRGLVVAKKNLRGSPAEASSLLTKSE